MARHACAEMNSNNAAASTREEGAFSSCLPFCCDAQPKHLPLTREPQWPSRVTLTQGKNQAASTEAQPGRTATVVESVLPSLYSLTHEHREAQDQERPRPHDPHEDAVLVEVILLRKVLPAIPKAGVDELTRPCPHEYYREKPDLPQRRTGS